MAGPGWGGDREEPFEIDQSSGSQQGDVNIVVYDDDGEQREITPDD